MFRRERQCKWFIVKVFEVPENLTVIFYVTVKEKYYAKICID